MILAAGLSPALQQILVFDALEPGEVNRAAETHWCASGKVLNVGQALATLGCDQRTVSILGGGTGQAIQRQLAAQGLDARWVWCSSPTRVCTTVIERDTGRVTELVQNAAPIEPATLEEFCKAYVEEADSAEIVVLTGSLPAGVPGTLFRDLLKQTPGRAILDVRGPELMAALECRPLLIKPNRSELSATFNHALDTDAALVSAMRELNARGAEWVLISQGPQAVWLTSRDAAYTIAPPAIPVINTIGSGDCLAAGIAWGLSERLDMLESVRHGIAAAMENARQLLPAQLDPQRVRGQAAALVAQRVAGG